MRSFFLIVPVLFLVNSILGSPASAQGSPGEDAESAPLQGMAQIDITGGLADRSAQYAMQQVSPAPAAPMPQQSMAALPLPYAGQSGYAGGNYSPAYPVQAPTQPQFGQYNQLQSPAWSSPPQSQAQASPVNSKLMTQMIGALGAATMINYMSNGGIDTVLGPLRSRGFSPRFHTYGSCIGGNVSF